VVVDGRGRDRLSARDGTPRVLDEAHLHARLDYTGGCTLRDIDTASGAGDLRALHGTAVARGFRAKVTATAPAEAADRTLLHMLLDDLPGAVLVSGYALYSGSGGHALKADPAAQQSFLAQRSNLCAGFATTATMLVELAETGILPMPTGPAAPALETPDDPAAWHVLPELPPGGIRRRRRMDVVEDGDRIRVEAMFRDSHRDEAGRETVIHEYALEAVLERHGLRVLSVEAEPRVLPWVECPLAAKSARSLVGQSAHELSTSVRRRLTGTSTCTHLNDLLRSLSDVSRLASDLESGQQPDFPD